MQPFVGDSRAEQGYLTTRINAALRETTKPSIQKSCYGSVGDLLSSGDRSDSAVKSGPIPHDFVTVLSYIPAFALRTNMGNKEEDDRPHFELDVVNTTVMEPFGIELAQVDNPLKDVERLYQEVQGILDEFEKQSDDGERTETVSVGREYLENSYEMTIPEDREYGSDAETLGAMFEIYEVDTSEDVNVEHMTPTAQAIVRDVQRIREEEGDTDAISIEDTIEAIQLSMDSNPDDQNTWWSIDSESADTILSYFTVVSSVIELRSAQLLKYLLIAEEYRTNDDITQWIEQRMNQHRRESLLYDMGLIDGTTKHEMQQVRGYRNEMVHDPLGRANINLGNVRTEMESGYEVVHEIDRLAKEKIDEGD